MKFKKIIILFQKYILSALFLYATRSLGQELGGIHDVKRKTNEPMADLHLEALLIEKVR
jgi:hypothetical protein